MKSSFSAEDDINDSFGGNGAGRSSDSQIEYESSSNKNKYNEQLYESFGGEQSIRGTNARVSGDGVDSYDGHNNESAKNQKKNNKNSTHGRGKQAVVPGVDESSVNIKEALAIQN